MFSIVGLLFVSLVLARVWLNSALLWNILSHVPRAVWEVLATVLDPISSPEVHAQEELIEFAASWIVALVLLLVIGSIALLARHLVRSRKTGTDHE